MDLEILNLILSGDASSLVKALKLSDKQIDQTVDKTKELASAVEKTAKSQAVAYKKQEKIIQGLTTKAVEHFDAMLIAEKKSDAEREKLTKGFEARTIKSLRKMFAERKSFEDKIEQIDKSKKQRAKDIREFSSLKGEEARVSKLKKLHDDLYKHRDKLSSEEIIKKNKEFDDESKALKKLTKERAASRKQRASIAQSAELKIKDLEGKKGVAGYDQSTLDKQIQNLKDISDKARYLTTSVKDLSEEYSKLTHEMSLNNKEINNQIKASKMSDAEQTKLARREGVKGSLIRQVSSSKELKSFGLTDDFIQQINNIPLNISTADFIKQINQVKNDVNDFVSEIKDNFKKIDESASKIDIGKRASKEIRKLEESGKALDPIYQNVIQSLKQIEAQSQQTNTTLIQDKSALKDSIAELEIANSRYSKKQKDISKDKADQYARTAAMNRKELYEFEINELKKTGAAKKSVAELERLYNDFYSDLNNLNKQDLAANEAALKEKLKLTKKTAALESKDFSLAKSEQKKQERTSFSLSKLDKDVELAADIYGDKALKALGDQIKITIGKVGKISAEELETLYSRLKANFDIYSKDLKRQGSPEQLSKLSEKTAMTRSGIDTQLLRADSLGGFGGFDSNNLVVLKKQFSDLDQQIQSGKRPINELITEYNRLSAIYRNLSEEIKSNKAAVSAAEKDYGLMRRGLYDTLNVVQSTIFFFGAMTAAITAFSNKMISSFTRYEETIQKFKGVSYTGGDIESLNAQTKEFEETVRKIAAGSKFMASDVARAGVVMAKLGLNIKEVTSALETVILASEASGESIETVAGVIVGVKEAFGKTAEDISLISNLLTKAALSSAADIESVGQTLKYVGPIARAAGQDLETITGITALLSKNMILGSQGGTTLRQALLRLVKITPEARKVLMALGVDTLDPLTREMKSMDSLLIEIAERFKDLPASTRNASLAILFGERAVTGMSAAFNEILNNKSEFQSFMDGFKAENVKGLTETMKKITFSGLFAEIIKLKSEIDDLNIAMGKAFKPTVEVLIVIFKSFVQTMKSIPEPIMQIGAGLTVTAGIFSSFALAVALVAKFVLSLKQALLVYAGSAYIASQANLNLAASHAGTQKAQLLQVASTRALTQATGALNFAFASGWVLFAKFIGIVAAIGAVIGGLTYIISKSAKEKEKFTEQYRLSDEQIAKSIEVREQYLKVLKKISNEERILSGDLKAQKEFFQGKADQTEKEIKKYQLALEALEDLKTGYSPGPKEREVLKDAFGEDELVDLYAKNSETVEKYQKIANERIEQRIILLEKTKKAVLDLGNAEKTASGFEGLEKELSKSEENLRILMDSYSKIGDDAELEKEIREEINKELSQYIIYYNEIQEHLGKEKLSNVEIIKKRTDALELNQRINAVLNKSQSAYKSIAEILKAQNEERIKAIELEKSQQDLLLSGEYAKALGVNIPNLIKTIIPDTVNKVLAEAEKAKNKAAKNMAENSASESELAKEAIRKTESVEVSGESSARQNFASASLPRFEEFKAVGMGAVKYGPEDPYKASQRVTAEYFQAKKRLEQQIKVSKNLEKRISDLEKNKQKTKYKSKEWENLDKKQNELKELSKRSNKRELELRKEEKEKYKLAINIGSFVTKVANKKDQIAQTYAKQNNNTLIDLSGGGEKPIYPQSTAKARQYQTPVFDKGLTLEAAQAQKAVSELKNQITEVEKSLVAADNNLIGLLETFKQKRSETGDKAREEELELAQQIMVVKKNINGLEEQRKDLIAKERENEIKLARDRVAFSNEQAAKEISIQQRIENLKRTDALKSIDLEYRSNLAKLEQEKQDEIIKLSTLQYTAIEFAKQKKNIEERYSQDALLLNAERNQRLIDEERRIQSEILNIRLDNQELVLESEPDTIRKRLALIDIEEKRKLDAIENEIQATNDMDKVLDLRARQAEIQYQTDLKREETILRTESERLAILKQQFDLLNRQNFTYQQIANLSKEISDVAFNKQSNVSEIIKGMVLLNKPIQRDSFSQFRETFNQTASKERSDLNKKLIAAEKELADIEKNKTKESAEYTTKFEQVLDLKQKIKGFDEISLAINDENLVVYGEMISKIQYLKQDFESISGSISNLSSVLSDIGNKGLADLITGTSKLTGSLLNAAENGTKLFAQIQKGAAPQVHGPTGEISGGGIAGIMGAIAGNPAALLALLPDLINIASVLGDAFISAFFPNFSNKFQAFKDDLIKKTNQLTGERDKRLLEQGDISEALFNERELNRVAMNYSVRLREIDREIQDLHWESFWNSVPATLAEGAGDALISLLPGGSLFNILGDIFGFNKSQLDTELDAQKAKIEEYRKALIEEAKFQKEEAERELKKNKILRESAFEFDMAELLGQITLAEAQIARNKDLEDDANFHLQKIALLKQYNEQRAEWVAAGGVENYQANEKFKQQSVLFFNQMTLLGQQHNDEMQKIDNDRVRRYRDANVALFNAMEDRSEFQKRQFEEESRFQNRIDELNLQLSQTSNQKEKDIINKEIEAAYKERSREIQRTTRETEQAFIDLGISIKESFASLTVSGLDNAMNTFERRINEIDQTTKDLLERFAGTGKENEIRQMQKNLYREASIQYTREMQQERIDLAAETAEITAQGLENQGKAVEALITGATGQAQKLIDAFQLDKILLSSPEDAQRLKNAQNKLQNDLYALAKQSYERMIELRKQDLDNYLEIEKIKAENRYDQFGVAKAEAGLALQALAFERLFAKETIKNQEQLNKAIELIDQREKKARREAVDAGANVLLNQLDQIKKAREEIYEKEIKVYESDIKRNEYEIRKLNKQIGDLERRRTEIEREIRDRLAEFDKEGTKEFISGMKGVSIPDTVMQALEFISNPTGIKYDDAHFETIAEAIDKEMQLRRDMFEYRLGMGEIEEKEYNDLMQKSYLEQAAVYQFAMNKIGNEHEKVIDRLREEGKTERELQVVRNAQMDNLSKFYKGINDARLQYIEIGKKEIEDMHKTELEGIEKSRQEYQDLKEDREESNRIAQDRISEAAERMETELKPVDEMIKEIEASMRNWSFSIQDVKQNMMGLVNNFKSNFEQFKKDIEAISITVPMDLPQEFKQILATVTGLAPSLTANQMRSQTNTSFSQAVQSNRASSTQARTHLGQTTTGTASGSNLTPYTITPIASTGTTGSTGTRQTASLSSGSIIQSSPSWSSQYPLTGKYYKSYSDQLMDESMQQKNRSVSVYGYSKGGVTGHTPMGSTSKDYILTALSNQELISPVRDFKDFAYSLIKDTSEGRIKGIAPASKTVINQFKFGHVYGVDDLERKIDTAINKANSRDGYYNSTYTTGYS